MFKEDVGTLAHELMHAKQWQDNYFWARNEKYLNLFYKFMYYSKVLYYYHPAESRAFKFALEYLKEEKLKEPQLEQAYKDYRNKVCILKFPLPIFIIVLVSLICVICLNIFYVDLK